MCRLRSFLLYAVVLCSSLVISASTNIDTTCFLYDLQLQCPPWFYRKPLAVDGNFLDEALNDEKRNGFTSILFHASWCPFSNDMLQQFEALSYMFPEIEHITVEQSSALPSVFSRNGIHSLPSIILVNKTAKFWYHGAKDVDSVSGFYQKITGQQPAPYGCPCECEEFVSKRFAWPSLEKDPYLVFALAFVVMRVMILVAPSVLRRVKALHSKYTPQFKVESIFERGFHMVDVRRMWAKMRICKASSFHEKAKSCRLWASSLASVSSSGRL